MRNIRKVLLIGVLSVFLLSGIAVATPVNLSGTNGEQTLQQILNGLTTSGSSSVNVATDQLADIYDSNWRITASGGSVATFIVEIAGYAQYNSLGIYDRANPNKRIELFSGVSTTGNQALMSIRADGSVYRNFTDTGIDFDGFSFGYYLTNAPGDTFFSDTTLNGDGFDHMVAYQGTDEDVVQLPGFAPGIWTDEEWILAWEDLYGGGDWDYNDLVLMVESVQPTPEPATMLMLGAGLVGLAGFGRKKLFK